jgi:GMP reductase
MRLIEDEKLDFSDVLIVPKRSEIESRKDVVLTRKFDLKYGTWEAFEGVPIIAANMATGNFAMAKKFQEYKMFTAIAKHNSEGWFSDDREIADLTYGFYTIGMSDAELKRLHEYSINCQFPKKIKICIDIANGYTQRFCSFVSKVRENFPDNVIVAGNVCTPEMTQQLILAGADIVKIGIGPGSMCKTREITGVGYPQWSATIENADAAHGLGAHIIVDGGMRTPGDICKAFCANADMVMIGGMFAGTDECEGELFTRAYQSDEWERIDQGTHLDYKPMFKERQFKLFYGMSSDYAQDTHFGGVKDYRASEGSIDEIEYKGPVDDIIKEILGGLRSCGAYIGAHSIKDFGKCASFVKVRRQK